MNSRVYFHYIVLITSNTSNKLVSPSVAYIIRYPLFTSSQVEIDSRVLSMFIRLYALTLWSNYIDVQWYILLYYARVQFEIHGNKRWMECNVLLLVETVHWMFKWYCKRGLINHCYATLISWQGFVYSLNLLVNKSCIEFRVWVLES